MKRQSLEIGHPLRITVHWYDHVPEPPRNTCYDGEIIGWRDSQVIVRVPDYAVVRFWKQTGLEVGNPDHVRRGFRVDLSELQASITPKPEVGLEVPLAIDTDA
jgi:hypothetical protein